MLLQTSETPYFAKQTRYGEGSPLKQRKSSEETQKVRTATIASISRASLSSEVLTYNTSM